MVSAKPQNSALIAALQWHIDQDCAHPWAHQPQDYRENKNSNQENANQIAHSGKDTTEHLDKTDNSSRAFSLESPPEPEKHSDPAPEGTARATLEALELANSAGSLEELSEAISAFDGLMVKNTATHMVFSDGLPGARVMIIGEAPGAEEDKEARPFVGSSGKLLDKMLSYIRLSRHSNELGNELGNELDNELGNKLKNAVYISNVLNWRPPGNRTPTPSEIEIARPFIEKHIALAGPEILLLCGGTATKSLLGGDEGITKRRGCWSEYRPSKINYDGPAITTLPVFHPSYLLKNPAQKKLAWMDLLNLRTRLDKKA